MKLELDYSSKTITITGSWDAKELSNELAKFKGWNVLGRIDFSYNPPTIYEPYVYRGYQPTITFDEINSISTTNKDVPSTLTTGFHTLNEFSPETKSTLTVTDN